MPEPSLIPTSEPGSNVLADLNPAKAQGQNPSPNPDPANHPPALSAEPDAGPVPSSGPKRNGDDDGHEDEGASKSVTARMLSSLGLVAQGTGSAAKQGVQLARRYPRASMASGLSAAILSGVMVLQPGKGKHDTKVEIANTAAPAQAAPADPQTASNAGAAAGKTVDSAPGSAPETAGSDPPVVFEGQDPKAGKITPDMSPPIPAPAPSPHPGLLAGEKPTPAPAVDESSGTGTASRGGH